ncbi:MAG: VWA domain-containing protein [Verrucomicrobiae bacterium]|nr:VWA domain-containing protein [Verrucomicrobiae bacterium]
MRFGNPHMLWLLLVLPPAVLVFLWRANKAKESALARFVEPRLLNELLAGASRLRRQIRYGLLTGAVACLVLALAKPQWGFDWEEVKQRGLHIIVAIDTSKSMLAEDVAPNRLTRAKLAALELAQQAKSDRIGLIAFAGTAFLQCPLTIDNAAFEACVAMLDVNVIPQGGTAIAEAILTAIRSFKSGPQDHKVLVIFSDGEDHDNRAVEAAAAAARAGIKVFTVGVGSAEGDLLRVRMPDGRTDYVRDPEGNVVKSRLNEHWLQQIATAGGGFYIPLRGPGAIETLYSRGIAPLPKSEGQARLFRRWHEKFHWPLCAAIVLLVIEMLLPERPRTNVIPTKLQQETGRVRPPVTIALAAVLALTGSAMASPSRALEYFRAGKFAEAQKEFERLAQEDKKGDLRLIFNAGVAAYRATNYHAAARHFEAALAAQDLKLQAAAYFNLGNTQYRLGAAAKDVDEVQTLWEAAIRSYQNALALDKNDSDAAFNLEFVKRAVAHIKHLREAAQRAKEEADEAIRRRNYRHALKIMEQLLQQNIAAKQFEDFTRKLREIVEIASSSE